jgi:hypothetical protein
MFSRAPTSAQVPGHVPTRMTSTATVVMNPPHQYNAGLANANPPRPYNNPPLAQSTLAEEGKWNTYYIDNNKTHIVAMHTEVEASHAAIGIKRQRDEPNISVDPIMQ